MSLAVFSLLLSLNRGSWIALSFSLFFAGIIFFPYVHIRWYFFIGIIIIITSLTLIMDRFDELNEFTPWGTSKNTFSGRIDHWMQLVDIAFQRFYLGWGPGTSRVVSNDLLSFNFVPHNDYLRLFLETGILGPLIFLFLIIKNIILAIFSSRDFGKWKIHYTILVIITYFFIIALPQNIIANVMLFPLFLALLASYNKIRTCFN